MSLLAKSLTTLTLLLPFAGSCQDLTPWAMRPLGFVPKIEYVVQSWDKGPDHLLDGSLTFARDDYIGEAEIFFAKTKKHNFYFNAVQFTGRKEIFQDTIGDLLQLTLGGTLTVAMTRATQDPSLFYPGNENFSLHAAFGKEWSYVNEWTYRTFGVLLAGVANKGSPWMRADWHLERQFFDRSSLGFALLGIYGFGKRSSSHHGYASVKYRGLDCQISYQFTPFDFGTFKLEYSYRVASLHFQNHLQRFSLQFIDWF